MLADVGAPKIVAPPPTLRARASDARVLAVLLILGYLGSGAYVVSADQQAVVVRLGKVVETRVPSGVHWTWPSPIARVYRLRGRESKPLTLGLDGVEPISRAQFLTGDRNVLNIRVVVQFAISDPVAYLFRAGD